MSLKLPLNIPDFWKKKGLKGESVETLTVRGEGVRGPENKCTLFHVSRHPQPQQILEASVWSDCTKVSCAN